MCFPLLVDIVFEAYLPSIFPSGGALCCQEVHCCSRRLYALVYYVQCFALPLVVELGICRFQYFPHLYVCRHVLHLLGALAMGARNR